MHYRDGRPAKDGDKVVQFGTRYLADGKTEPTLNAVGILHDTVPGQTHCNGNIASTIPALTGACIVDCLHVETLMELVKAAGLDKRPEGK